MNMVRFFYITLIAAACASLATLIALAWADGPVQGAACTLAVCAVFLLPHWITTGDLLPKPPAKDANT